MTPWTTAHQASLSITNSWSLLKLMSIEPMMPSNYLILYCPVLLLLSIFPTIRMFYSESVLSSGGQSIGASASSSVLPMNIQGSFWLRLTGLISLLSMGLSRVLPNTTVQKYQFPGALRVALNLGGQATAGGALLLPSIPPTELSLLEPLVVCNPPAPKPSSRTLGT